MKNYGTVSIITPAYNAAKFIGETIESVLKQTYPYWELLITDDCSSDDTVHLVEEYAQRDSRIKLFVLEQNAGAAAARNSSIAKAQGRYIAFLDGDDWWYPNKLEVQLDFMEKHQYEFVFSAFEYADEHLNVTGVSWKPRRISKRTMKIGCNIGTPGVIYDTKRIGKIYMPELKTGEDWGTWLRVVQQTGYAYAINTPLWKYRVIKGSLSSNKWKLVQNDIKMYREVLGYSKVRSLLMFTFLFLPNHFLKLIRNKMDSRCYCKRRRSLAKTTYDCQNTANQKS